MAEPIEPFRLLPVAGLARFVLRTAEPAAIAAGEAFGLVLPPMLRLAARGGRGEPGARLALRFGPDEWLLVLPLAEGAGMADAMRASLIGRPHALVEVTDRQAGYLLQGPAAAEALAAGCPLDLDLRAFPVGMATRTLFHKAEIQLWRMAADAFRIEVLRSFAPYLEAMFAEIRHDFVALGHE